MEYILWCDESEKNGIRFSNFYGGILVQSDKWESIVTDLENKKKELNLFSEIKWTKITAQYYEKYIAYIDYFWRYVESGDVKIRIMFTQNKYKPTNLTREQKEGEFYILYYEFMKHAFGFMSKIFDEGSTLRIMFDKLPDKKEKNENFKNYVYNLSNQFVFCNITIPYGNISEVDSRKHVLLQSMDIFLGAMDFRLNNKHLEKPEGSRTRGKKTIAKEKVYKHIFELIRKMYGYNFNIGMSTGWRLSGTKEDRWDMPYRHWCFESRIK